MARSPFGVVTKSVRRPGAVWLEIVRVNSIKFGSKLAIDAVVIPISPPVCGELNEYVNVGSRKFPCTHIFTVVVPDVGLVTVTADAWIVQLDPSGETMPTNSTFTGEVVAPAVVGSTTTMLSPNATGELLVSEIAVGGCDTGKITNETGFDSVAGDPGF